MALEALQIALTNLAALGVCFLALWALSLRLKDASIVDVFWGPACAIPAVVTLASLEAPGPRAFLLTGLVCLWALRLAAHLARRNLGHGEDPRYQAMRRGQPSDAAFARWSLVWVFGLQCLVAWFVSLPVQLGQIGGGALGPLAAIGAAVFAIGLSFEAVGDWQLRRFKADPANAGRLMTGGLWAWTRHPNYFGDACVWWGLGLIALEGPLGWAAALSPAVMTHFLINVSGKALLERSLKKRYADYEPYMARTSGFFPRPPKSKP
jgi:steroid 5-alpha reductase family enzyme